jgi:glyoxylase-like metal-dependent hydrolase (beta-lactamase superfamily II)
MSKLNLHCVFAMLMLSVSWLPGMVVAQQEKAGPILVEYTAEQVSPSTYVIHGPLESPNPQNQGFMNNPAFIIGDTGIIVIDPGSTVQVGDLVLRIIKSISDLPVVATFSTHIHGDHWLGNQAIAEAYPDTVFYAHPNLILQANEGEGQAWVDTMMTLTEGGSAGTVYVAPDKEVDDGHHITIAGKTFAIYHDPLAHTDSDIAVQLLDEKVLFLGDTVMNRRLGRLDDGNYKGLIAFLDRMLEVNAEVFIPGHGKTADAQIVRDFRDFFQTVFTVVAEEYENGLSDFEIKPIVNDRLADAARWTDLEESLGKLVSLAYLEIEEDSF